jgi:hypothetical protein
MHGQFPKTRQRFEVVIVPVPRRLLFLQQNDDFGAAIHVLARAQPELLIAALEREVTDLPDGIPAADRFTREDDLKQHILDLERSEEALVVAAAHNGVTLDPCHRANPLAILGRGVRDGIKGSIGLVSIADQGCRRRKERPRLTIHWWEDCEPGTP